MSPEGWSQEKSEICEGFDHPDAPPLDTEAAAAQLKQATRDLQVRLLVVLLSAYELLVAPTF